MHSIIRVTAAVPKTRPANPFDCLDEIRQLLTRIPASDIIVLPALTLCPPSCGNLAGHSLLAEQCAEALDLLCAETKLLDSYLLVGLLQNDWGKSVSAVAVLHRGQVVAVLPATDTPAIFAKTGFSQRYAPMNTVFACGDLRFRVLTSGLCALAENVAELAKTGCDLIIIPAYAPVYAGLYDQTLRTARELSRSTGCAIALVNGGVGDTSAPYLYCGFAAVYESGAELLRVKSLYESFYQAVDLDLDVIASSKISTNYVPPIYAIQPAGEKPGLLRKIDANPFLQGVNVPEYLTELFEMQVSSLVRRMENIGISRLVLGISGGLDSTAAMLVSAGAMDVLGISRANIHAISMPGFGTSDRTYYNALRLTEQIGATGRDISIKQSVQQHFEDIGHSGKKDTTYENAQARERAQILLDIANLTGGIVVGTGDLSEAAMGFTTFAGDHIANYNVNICITKTVLRALVRHIAETSLISGVAETLGDILDTPISPELLPAAENGEIAQKTEDILAPYELLDFFLYYFVRYRFRPSKIYYYACVAFSGRFEPMFIHEKLKKFITSFCAGQFKRACAPDSAAITQVNLSGVNFYIPSDLDCAGLLAELDEAGVF